MPFKVRTFILFCLASILGGCSSEAPKIDPNHLPDAAITSAAFKGGDPNTVIITGEYFKIKSDNKKDVVTSLNGRNWSAATSISSSSPTTYTAVLPYGISFSQVWVRVYGLNEEYSAPYLIGGQRREAAVP